MRKLNRQRSIGNAFLMPNLATIPCLGSSVTAQRGTVRFSRSTFTVSVKCPIKMDIQNSRDLLRAPNLFFQPSLSALS